MMPESPLFQRVLVVEDHEPLRFSLERTLADRFPEVRSCATRREALGLLASYAPDLLLLDLVLPDGTGLEIARSALRSLPGVRVIAMSGSASDDTFASPTAEGVSHHVRKPLTSAALERVLDAAGADAAPPEPDEGANLAEAPPSDRTRRARIFGWLRGRDS